MTDESCRKKVKCAHCGPHVLSSLDMGEADRHRAGFRGLVSFSMWEMSLTFILVDSNHRSIG